MRVCPACGQDLPAAADEYQRKLRLLVELVHMVVTEANIKSRKEQAIQQRQQQKERARALRSTTMGE